MTETPDTKHCHAGVGHVWDHVCGDSSGEEGAGEELDTPLSPPWPDTREVTIP